jgi:hypothetical protein
MSLAQAETNFRKQKVCYRQVIFADYMVAMSGGCDAAREKQIREQYFMDSYFLSS